MLHTSRRQWRLFRLALFLVLALALPIVRTTAQTPTLTTVSDTVYRADGSPANGTLLISWPEFTTANASTIAAGNKSVTLGTNGSLT